MQAARCLRGMRLRACWRAGLLAPACLACAREGERSKSETQPAAGLGRDSPPTTVPRCLIVSAGRIANHWDLFEYRMASCGRSELKQTHWLGSHQEPSALYEKRLRMLRREADDDTQRKISERKRSAG